MRIIGIIGAMEEEVRELKKMMEAVEVSHYATMEFTAGVLAGKRVVVVCSGIGKVNAAVCAQILIDRFDVNTLINTGVGGALYQELNIGDIVLSEDTLQYDMDASGSGDEPGVIPRMDCSIFPGDEKLLKTAEEVCAAVNPDIHVYRGRVLSGDQFISEQEKKKWLAETFDGYCAEMEGAAIGQTAYLNRIPFLIVRAISDRADGSASMEYYQFKKQAILHTVPLLTGILEKL